MYIEDPLLDFMRHDSDAEEKLLSCPICKACGEHIQDDIYCIDHGNFHLGCIKEYIKIRYPAKEERNNKDYYTGEKITNLVDCVDINEDGEILTEDDLENYLWEELRA